MGRAAGFQVLETTGVESETQLPFAGLHQMLRPLRESIECPAGAGSVTACWRRSGRPRARLPSLPWSRWRP